MLLIVVVQLYDFVEEKLMSMIGSCFLLKFNSIKCILIFFKYVIYMNVIISSEIFSY